MNAVDQTQMIARNVLIILHLHLEDVNVQRQASSLTLSYNRIFARIAQLNVNLVLHLEIVAAVSLSFVLNPHPVCAKL